MSENRLIQGFSKLTSNEKRGLAARLTKDPQASLRIMASFFHPEQEVHKVLSSFSENTLTNYPLPYSVAPNFLINGRLYMVPMVIEESSVVAAASAAARFWASRGGFRARVNGTEKTGQLHFRFTGDAGWLENQMPRLDKELRQRTVEMSANMVKRGGGITSLQLRPLPEAGADCYQLLVGFETADAMGANFINSVLEEFAAGMRDFFDAHADESGGAYETLMAILSNYTPGCTVSVEVSCPLEQLGVTGGLEAPEFARRFERAVRIATEDPYRATTHNKGIMNGVDAVVLATGNDFRAVEAAAHAHACRSGQYRSLSRASVEAGRFSFSLEMPLALGTLGGLTRLHPLADLSLEILGRPGARDLMMIAGAAGLANNFAAVRSLVTTGIQAGHMRMHLPNILLQLGATPGEQEAALGWFRDKKTSHQAVSDYLKTLRNKT
jgi:hydroxymethylglutaryl-CoA reductase